MRLINDFLKFTLYLRNFIEFLCSIPTVNELLFYNISLIKSFVICLMYCGFGCCLGFRSDESACLKSALLLDLLSRICCACAIRLGVPNRFSSTSDRVFTVRYRREKRLEPFEPRELGAEPILWDII